MLREQDDPEARIRAHCDRAEYSQAATLAIETYGPDLLRFIGALVHNAAEAADVFSQVCEAIWHGLPQRNGSSSFRTWSYAVARNACYSHLRSPVNRRPVPLSEAGVVQRLADSVRASTQRYLRTDVKDELRKLRSELSSDEQSLLTLRIDRGLEWNEIVQILATAPVPEAELKRAAAACRKRFERLTDKLRELATEAGLLGDERL